MDRRNPVPDGRIDAKESIKSRNTRPAHEMHQRTLKKLPWKGSGFGIMPARRLRSRVHKPERCSIPLLSCQSLTDNYKPLQRPPLQASRSPTTELSIMFAVVEKMFESVSFISKTLPVCAAVAAASPATRETSCEPSTECKVRARRFRCVAFNENKVYSHEMRQNGAATPLSSPQGPSEIFATTTPAPQRRRRPHCRALYCISSALIRRTRPLPTLIVTDWPTLAPVPRCMHSEPRVFAQAQSNDNCTIINSC